MRPDACAEPSRTDRLPQPLRSSRTRRSAGGARGSRGPRPAGEARAASQRSPAPPSTLPLLGLLAAAYRERWSRAQEDLFLFVPVLLNPRHRDRLARQRAILVAEFDAIARELRDASPGALAH